MPLKRVRIRRDDAVAQVDWRQLEALLARHYEAQGYEVTHVGTGGTDARYDGGIDLKLRRDDEYLVVQVKHWNAYKVPHNDVHQLLGVMVNEGATGAILVTSGEFTQAAIEAANRHGHVRLIDGDGLRSILGPHALAAVDAHATRADEFVRTMSAPAHERPRAQVRSHGSGGRESQGWIALSVAGFLIFALLIWGVLKKTEGTAGPPRPPTQETASDAPQFTDEQELQPAFVLEGDPPVIEGECKDEVHAASSAYTDGCARPPSARHRSTPADIREQQRRADEAARILEASTPEM